MQKILLSNIVDFESIESIDDPLQKLPGNKYWGLSLVKEIINAQNDNNAGNYFFRSTQLEVRELA